MVLIKYRHPGSKFRLPFEPRAWKITDIKGTMITAQRGGESITRNVSFFKKHVLPRREEDRAEQQVADTDDPLSSEPELVVGTSRRSPSQQPRRHPDRNHLTRYRLRAYPSQSQRYRNYVTD